MSSTNAFNIGTSDMIDIDPIIMSFLRALKGKEVIVELDWRGKKAIEV